MSRTDIKIAPCPLKVFFCEPIANQKRFLRRYKNGISITECQIHGYHNVMNYIGDFPVEVDDGIERTPKEQPSHDDPRWPKKCDCGYNFQEADEWQVFTERIYKSTVDGRLLTIRDKVPGMVWDAKWLHGMYPSPDGRILCAICPDGHEWHIDGRCSNCTLHDDKEHKCWTRNTDLNCLDVGKNYQRTCSAGAGSILTPNWHGFLRKGFFVTC